jgi:hypothetical protein
MKKISNISFSIFRLIIVLILFIPIIYNEYEKHLFQILYVNMFDVPIYFICLGVFILVVVFDILLYVKQKNIMSLTPSIIGVILISISFTIYKYHNYKIHQKTIFKAISNVVEINDYDDIEYIIEFKEQNNYLVEEHLHQGIVTNYYYGKFTKKDSIYVLDNNICFNKISNRFVIRTITNKDKKEIHLIQLNQKNNQVINKFQFNVKWTRNKIVRQP